MLIDGRALPRDEVADADVCIVGSGPAGLTLAMTLAEQGVRALVVEAGGVDQDAASLRLCTGENVGSTYFALERTRVKALGGTSAHWTWGDGLRARPLDAVDFEARPGVPDSGWPFGLDELEPFYRRAQDLCELGPYDYDTTRWTAASGLRPFTVGGRVDTAMFQLTKTKGFVRFLPRLTRAEWPKVLLHSAAAELHTSDDGARVTTMAVKVAADHGFNVTARHYVLAAGGLENARILLLSRSHTPAGLGNAHDLVGRYFMEHLRVRSGVLRPADAALARAASPYTLHHVDGVALHGKLRLAEHVVRDEQLLNSSFFLEPHPAARGSEGVRSLQVLREVANGFRPLPPRLPRHVGLVLRDAPAVARAAWHHLRGTTRARAELFVLRAMAEQAPNRDSRVMLSRRLDPLGMPQVRVDWRLTELDRRSLRRAQDIFDEDLRAAGVGCVTNKLGEDDVIDPVVGGYWHHMGTTRMHADPRHGVVDADGRVHSVTNLYACGSSTFPTGGYANPSLTIVALALRLARHLGDRLEARQG